MAAEKPAQIPKADIRLIDAIKEGNLGEVNSLLEAKANPNLPQQGKYPLGYAAALASFSTETERHDIVVSLVLAGAGLFFETNSEPVSPNEGEPNKALLLDQARNALNYLKPFAEATDVGNLKERIIRKYIETEESTSAGIVFDKKRLEERKPAIYKLETEILAQMPRINNLFKKLAKFLDKNDKDVETFFHDNYVAPSDLIIAVDKLRMLLIELIKSESPANETKADVKPQRKKSFLETLSPSLKSDTHTERTRRDSVSLTEIAGEICDGHILGSDRDSSAESFVDKVTTQKNTPTASPRRTSSNKTGVTFPS